MLMFYTRTFAAFGLLTHKRFIPEFLNEFKYKLNNGKLYSSSTAIMLEEYDDYDYEKEMRYAMTSEICGYCRGTKHVRCNLCRTGCVSCNFSELRPCPFCNNKTQNVSYTHTNFIKTNIPWPKSATAPRQPRDQYRVPL